MSSSEMDPPFFLEALTSDERTPSTSSDKATVFLDFLVAKKSPFNVHTAQYHTLLGWSFEWDHWDL